jgi:putative addiction module antidote
MFTTQLTQVGNSIGIVLPPEALQKLNAASGDELCLIETPNGLEIVALDPKQAAQLRVARQVIVDNRDALEQLAK